MKFRMLNPEIDQREPGKKYLRRRKWRRLTQARVLQ